MVWLTLRGAVEGMVMTRYTDIMAASDAPDDMDGVRVHRWFRVYHIACIARDAALMSCIMALWYFTIPPVTAIAGSLFIGWELFEAAYNSMRHGTPVTAHENFFGIKSIDGKAVWTIHLARVLVGAALIVGGMT